ncbi:YdcF family protein [Phyllobacterium zundukense]|uniref:YdcF family protein n=1 Tax=Phyllobacterium zundukense TaxID=1867719 RepID=UPI001F1BC731|nr:YdcF family protein [Phyllobacterium zundukense]
MNGLNDSNSKPDAGDEGRGGRLISFIRRRIVVPLFILCIIFIGLFIGGFIVFSDRVSTLQAPDLSEPADGIVVLTGGYSRIEGALDLLKNKRGERLFISGVHSSTNRNELQRVTGGDATLFECCVDIDRSALDTIGNAAESVKWANANHYKRIIVVTNNYHIPRTMFELKRASQDIEFIPYPIINTNLKDGNWITRGLVVRVLFVEYVKYLGAVIRYQLPASLSDATASLLHRIKG